MAKSAEFKIKIDGKQLDLTKISFKDFNKVITDAKKNLKELPLNDPRYKTLTTDIKTAEKAWKEATKAAGDFNNENKQGAEDVQTYKQQIRETTNELQKAEQQFGKNSEEANKLRDRLKELKDEQDDFNETTRKLDDSLAGIPGPIGQIGQSMGQLGNITNSAKSAFGSLSKQFPILDNAWKATGIGLLVGLVLGLVAAVVKAAQSFKPLQDAFAGLQDALGSVLEALKPVTDFFLKIFVGAIKIVSEAINGLLRAFGAVPTSFKTQSLQLEREIKKQEAILNNYGSFLSEYYSKILNLEKKYNEDKKAIADDELKTVDEKNKELKALDAKLQSERAIIEKQREKITRDNEININKIKGEAAIENIYNQRTAEDESIKLQKEFQYNQANSEIKAANGRIIRTNVLIKELKKIDSQYFKDTIDALEKSIEDEKNLVKDLGRLSQAEDAKIDAESSRRKRERYREDINLTKERSLAIQQLSTQLIREDNERNLQAAKDSLESLKEQQRVELEEAKLAGVTLKNLKEKQVKEQLVALENIRKAQIQLDAYVIQQEIDKQQRLVTEAGVGTQQYFDARKQVIEKEFEKELLLADMNQNEIQNARTKYWKALLELDKEGLQAQISQIQLEYDGLYDGTVAFFDKQRELEKKNYELRQKELQGNYDALEALNRQHQKNMNLIDAAQIQNSSDIQMRKFAALGTMNQAFFDEARKGEELFYEAERKRAGDNNALLEVIELEHIKRVAEIDAQQKEAKLQVYSAIAQITAEFGSILSGIAQEQLKNAQGTDKARFESAKKFAKAAIIVERVGAIGQIVANTGIANAKAVAASPLTFGQPWVTINTIAAGVSIAGIIASAIKSINDINGQEFQPSGGTGGNRMGRGYEKGGLIDGPRHAQGGTMIEAEGGEAVMTRGAVTMFGPLLSMMNQAGGGTTFQPNLMTTLMDKPVVSNPSEDEKSMIVKTYVVESELTSSQQRQARLKDLSTL